MFTCANIIIYERNEKQKLYYWSCYRPWQNKTATFFVNDGKEHKSQNAVNGFTLHWLYQKKKNNPLNNNFIPNSGQYENLRKIRNLIL